MKIYFIMINMMVFHKSLLRFCLVNLGSLIIKVLIKTTYDLIKLEEYYNYALILLRAVHITFTL